MPCSHCTEMLPESLKNLMNKVKEMDRKGLIPTTSLPNIKIIGEVLPAGYKLKCNDCAVVIRADKVEELLAEGGRHLRITGVCSCCQRRFTEYNEIEE